MKKLGLLEAGRAFAALAVVIHHASLSADAFGPGSYAETFDLGALGVDFFFVLSGFIISYAHFGDELSANAAWEFAKKRAKRIYIPYIPVSLAMIALYLSFPGLSQGGARNWDIFTSLTLFPSGAPPALSVAWTLVYEVMFYMIFVLFYVTHHFLRLMFLWGLVVSGLWFAGVDAGNGVLGTILNPHILEFLAGMVSALMFRRTSEGWKWPLCIGIAALAIFLQWPDAHRVFFGLAIAPVVLGMARLERQTDITVPSVLLFLGSASYAIYLVHNPVQSVVARLMVGANNWIASFVACVIISTAAGVLYHLAYERPVLRLLRPVAPKHNRELVN